MIKAINKLHPEILFLLMLLLTVTGGCRESSDKSNLAAYVDPFIGTGGHGHTYPGATLPFGMIQLSPDNGTQGWDWSSGYHYSDSIIAGFSHTHLSGTGIGDLCDISVMPVTGKIRLNQALDKPNYASSFLHSKEAAEPGFYKVHLEDYNISVELTTTKRVGFHKYEFAETDTAAIIFNLGFAINWDAPVSTSIKVENDSVISGYRISKGWAADQRIYFTAHLSRPFRSYILLNDGHISREDAMVSGKKVLGKFDFKSTGEPIYMKVALSSSSINNAKENLKEELPHWDFERTKKEAGETWSKALSGIQVTTANDSLKKIFYTALYHTKLAPTIFNDVNGEFKGADGKIHQAANYERYTVFSLWDTFRAAHPLFTVTDPERINDMIQSMLSHYKQYGLLPVWELHGNETNTMTGYHAIPVIVDAYFKGFRDYDIELAYEAMKKSAMQDIRGVNHYKKYGYIPSNLENESVTKNLEYAYDDWCLAQMARDLGKKDDYDYFNKRSNSYKLLFDGETGFMRGKTTEGIWREPFDPKHSSHRVNTDYTEGNAWQHSWFVPHDIYGLIELHGGPEPFIKMLDSLFQEKSTITGDNISPDISGLIGQYAHGNEPSHHIAYLYNYAGQPWKTQRMIREILDQMYHATPMGISGNEDCGQMSAWYVFSAMGFYPVNPASGVYAIGSPVFDKVSIRVNENATFDILANNMAKDNIYIESVSLNDKHLNRPYLTHKEIMDGGKLVINMSNTATDWGVLENAQIPDFINSLPN